MQLTNDDDHVSQSKGWRKLTPIQILIFDLNSIHGESSEVQIGIAKFWACVPHTMHS